MTEVPTYEIYQLSDPRDCSIRYIGISRNAAQRYQQHLRCMGENREKNVWIQELQAQGLKPVLSILETEESERCAREREAFWIRLHTERGGQLFNIMENQSPEGVYYSPRQISAEQREDLAQLEAEGQQRFGENWEMVYSTVENLTWPLLIDGDKCAVDLAKIALRFCELQEMWRRK